MPADLNRKKVLLITPPYHAGVLESAGRWPHLGFIYIAGHLRAAGFEPVIYDAMTKGHDLRQISQRIKAEQPSYVGVTAYTSSFYAAMDVLRAAKMQDPGITTFIGGVHAHFCYEETLRDYQGAADFVIRGEGEATLPELLSILEAGGDPGQIRGVAFLKDGRRVIMTPDRPRLHNLDSLIPAWDLVEWKDYTFFPLAGSRLAIVSSSRGCEHDCSFCSQQKFWERSYRERDPFKFVDELEYLSRTYGVNVFMLSDEYPTRNGIRWEKILDEIIRRDLGVHLLIETRVEDIIRDEAILPKYRRAGVLHVYVGVEATCQDRLDYFKKDIKCQDSKKAIDLINRNGMVSECSFVLGLPEDTTESIAQTLELARYYDPDLPQFLHLAPWPYSDIYREMEPYIVSRDYARYNFVEPVLKPRNMTVEEMTRALIGCYKDYYMNKVWRYMEEKDEFKREYLLRSTQMMMKNSFLAQYTGLGGIPREVEALLKSNSRLRA